MEEDRQPRQKRTNADSELKRLLEQKKGSSSLMMA
jgi:hypothetical protein